MTQPTAIANILALVPENAEDAVIGCILGNGQEFDNVRSVLSEESFFALSCRIIWQAFERLHERKEFIDLLTTQNELRDMGKLDEIGGASKLTQLAVESLRFSSPANYARIVDRAYTRRQLLQAGEKIVSMACDTKQALEHIEVTARELVPAVFSRRKDDAIIPAKSAVTRALEHFGAVLDGTAPIAISTGYPEWDALLGGGFFRRDFTIMGGRPSMGKSALALSMIVKQMTEKESPPNIFLASMEMDETTVLQRMVSVLTGVPFSIVRTGRNSAGEEATPKDIQTIVDGYGVIAQWPLLMDFTPSLTPLVLHDKIGRMKGVDLVVVDYLQLMRAGDNVSKVRVGNREQEITYIAGQLKEIAKAHNTHVFALASLNREVDKRHDKRPLLSDFREGGIEYDADGAFGLYRDAVYNSTTEFPNRAQIIGLKARNSATGIADLYYQKELTRFVNGATRSISLRMLEEALVLEEARSS